jgi:hypothetical protein
MRSYVKKEDKIGKFLKRKSFDGLRRVALKPSSSSIGGTVGVSTPYAFAS